MQSMNSVTVSGDKSIVSIGSGNRWGNVYTTLDPQDLVMVGGRVTQVGVGGLLTGGTSSSLFIMPALTGVRWRILLLRALRLCLQQHSVLRGCSR
jgi:hypothetical protein